MAIKKVQIIPPNYTDIIHPETDSSVVLMGSGKTLQTVSNRNQRFVIGISTAGWTLDDCDYLCDGVADQVEINNAITALPTTGGEIVILDGTYNITAKIKVIKDNVSIRGNGNATILKRMFNSSVKEGVISLTGNSGCKIADLQVDGNKASYTNSNNYGIYLVSSTNNTVTGNTCNNNNSGVYLYASSKYNIITGNTCNNNSTSGIQIEFSDNNTITGNTCICGTGLSTDYTESQYTIRFYSTSNNYNLITNNNCMGKAPTVGGGIGNTVINNKWNDTSDFEDLSTQVDTNKTDILSLETTVGDVAMTTSAQTVKGAINELDADIGNKATLITTDKTNLVSAVNENREQINSLDADVTAHKEEDASQDNVHGLRGTSLALGQNSEASSNRDRPIALGHSAKATNWDSIAVGYDAKSTGQESIAIGQRVLGSATGSIVLGLRSEVSGNQSIAIGSRVTVQNECEGVFGGTDDLNTTTKWIVPGSFTVNGTKNFEIPHPKPEKQATHRIRHGAVESPTAGDTLYRWKIQATKDNDKVTIDLPDYFIYLNKNVQIWVTGREHFGSGYGKLNKETEQIVIHCQYEGEYNVLVVGTRNDDHQSVQDWDIKGVEREIGESWTGETYAFSVEEIMEVEEIKEEVA